MDRQQVDVVSPSAPPRVPGTALSTCPAGAPEGVIRAPRDGAARVDASDVAAHLRRAEREIAALRGLAITATDPAALRALPALLEKLSRSAAALRARVLSAIADDGSWREDGQTKLESWLSAATNTSWVQSRRELDRARALDQHLPQFREALESGTIGTDHLDAAVRYTLDSDQRARALTDPHAGAGLLATAAQGQSVASFTTTLRSWAATTDAATSDHQWRDAMDREHLSLTTTSGGGVRISGLLTEENGLLLRTALNAHTGRPAAGETRTRAQLDAAALSGLARIALDSGTMRPSSRVRPHLMVTVPAATAAALASATLDSQRAAERAALARAHQDCSGNRATVSGTGAFGTGDGADHRADDADGRRARGACGPECIAEVPDLVIPAALDAGEFAGIPPATFSTGTPLAPSQLAKLLCDSAITRIVFDAEGEPLDVGREKRTFTAAQTKGIITRDRRCQFPGCDARPEWCEAHHVVWYTRNGMTAVDNGILLCWSHHTEVHRLSLSITKYRDRWEYFLPDGRLHGTRPRDHSHTVEPPALFSPAA